MNRDMQVFRDEESLSAGAASKITELLRGVLERQERASLVLTGGGTPRKMYGRLAEYHRTALDWRRVDLFWGDERFVPPDHPESNYRMAASTLLSGIEFGEVHSIPTTVDSPSRSAEEYERTIRDYFGENEVKFDVMLLGLGEDAHVASLFPGSASLDESDKLVLPTQAPDDAPIRDRVSMTLPALSASRTVLFLVSGESKSSAVRRALDKDDDAPASRISAREQVLWYVDKAAYGGP